MPPRPTLLALASVAAAVLSAAGAADAATLQPIRAAACDRTGCSASQVVGHTRDGYQGVRSVLRVGKRRTIVLFRGVTTGSRRADRLQYRVATNRRWGRLRTIGRGEKGYGPRLVLSAGKRPIALWNHATGPAKAPRTKLRAAFLGADGRFGTPRPIASCAAETRAARSTGRLEIACRSGRPDRRGRPGAGRVVVVTQRGRSARFGSPAAASPGTARARDISFAIVPSTGRAVLAWAQVEGPADGAVIATITAAVREGRRAWGAPAVLGTSLILTRPAASVTGTALTVEWDERAASGGPQTTRRRATSTIGQPFLVDG